MTMIHLIKEQFNIDEIWKIKKIGRKVWKKKFKLNISYE